MLRFIILSAFIVLFVLPFIAGLTDNKTLKRLYRLSDPNTVEYVEYAEDVDENKLERIQLQENTIAAYHQLLDTLAEQIKTETDEKKKAILLRQQISTLEKYNRALEKLERLNNEI